MIAKLSSIVRETLESRLGRPSVGWLWPVVALLALTGCSFEPYWPKEAITNPLPHTTLVYCDIEKPLERHCATATDKAIGVRLAAAAVALAAGDSGGNIGLDDSPDALARCFGEPEAVRFRGPFPIGNPLCLNGFTIGPPLNDPVLTDPLYADATAACVAQCERFFGQFDDVGAWILDDPPDDPAFRPFIKALCQQTAHASTNVSREPNPGFAGGCTPGGIARPDFADPRRISEPVIWVDRIGVAPIGSGNSLKASDTGSSMASFNAGAASAQMIAHGDGYIEFAAGERDRSHVIGFSTPAGADADPSLSDVQFGINLDSNNGVYVVENGGANVYGPFCAYQPGERFRVTVMETSTYLSTISYSRISGPSDPGMPCPESVYTSTAGPAHYPFRVDASFREKPATLSDVRMVRIH